MVELYAIGYIFKIFVVWIISDILHLSDCTCSLPPDLVGQWTDVAKNVTVDFTSSKLTGWTVEVASEPKHSHTCILNTGNVYIFVGDETYSEVSDKSYFLCMKLTKVSSNLYYYYLLADQNSKASNQERIYTPDMEPNSATIPTCDYCTFTSTILDSEYNFLQRHGTSELPMSSPSLCLPCDKICTTQLTSPSESRSTNTALIVGLSVSLGVAALIGVSFVFGLAIYKSVVINSKVAAAKVITSTGGAIK